MKVEVSKINLSKILSNDKITKLLKGEDVTANLLSIGYDVLREIKSNNLSEEDKKIVDNIIEFIDNNKEVVLSLIGAYKEINNTSHIDKLLDLGMHDNPIKFINSVTVTSDKSATEFMKRYIDNHIVGKPVEEEMKRLILAEPDKYKLLISNLKELGYDLSK